VCVHAIAWVSVIFSVLPYGIFIGQNRFVCVLLNNLLFHTCFKYPISVSVKRDPEPWKGDSWWFKEKALTVKWRQ
jgi:hypothetical protein